MLSLEAICSYKWFYVIILIDKMITAFCIFISPNIPYCHMTAQNGNWDITLGKWLVSSLLLWLFSPLAIRGCCCDGHCGKCDCGGTSEDNGNGRSVSPILSEFVVAAIFSPYKSCRWDGSTGCDLIGEGTIVANIEESALAMLSAVEGIIIKIVDNTAISTWNNFFILV
jgi:hypothetical protein